MDNFYTDNMNIREIDGFTLQLVSKNVWAIDEFGIDIMYLIVGTKKALLFDTGIGIGNIKNVIKELTDLPLVIVNSHHHYDHSGGNYCFEKIYAHASAIPVIQQQNTPEFRKDFLLSQEARNEYNHRASLHSHITCINHSELIELKEEKIFDLGDRTLEVLFTPGHTKDCICLLDSKNELLFSGDTIVSTPTLLFDSFSDTAQNYLDSITKLLSYSNKYNLIFPGHYLRPIGKNYLKDMAICLKEILQDPDIGKPDSCNMALGPVYYHQYRLASILYTKDRCI